MNEATDENIIRRMRFACWIMKVKHTHTHRIRNNYCFSKATMVTWTRLKVTFIRTLPVFVIQLAASRTHFLYALLSAQLLKNFLALSRTRSFTSVCTRVTRVISLLNQMNLVWNITPYLFEGHCYITVSSWSGLLLSDRCPAYKYLFFFIDKLYLFYQFISLSCISMSL
jgi:hypothetical protein